MATYFSPTRFAGGTSLGNLYVRLSVNPQQFLSGMSAARGSVAGMSSSLMGLTKVVTGSLTAMAAVSAVAVNEFAKFDKAMTNSLSIMEGVNAGMRASLEETAKALSLTTNKSAAELAEGYFFLASAGYDAAQSMKALPVVAKMATAGTMSMTDATNQLVNAQAALGLTSEDAAENMRQMTRIADVLAKADMEATGTIEEFADALTNKAAAAMRQWGISVEEGVAVLAAFAQQGLRGKAAGEAFNQLTRDLMTAALKKAEMFRKLKVDVFDANNELRYLPDILLDMEKAFNGASDATKRADLKLMGFQDRSVKAIMTLMGTSEQIRKYDQQLKNAGGTLDTIFNKQMEAFSNKMLVAWHRIQLVLISMGQELAPTIMELTEDVVGLLESFAKWNTETGAILGTINTVVDVVKTLSLAVMILWTALKSVANMMAVQFRIAFEIGNQAFQTSVQMVNILWNVLKSLGNAFLATAKAAVGFAKSVSLAAQGDFSGAAKAAMEGVKGVEQSFKDVGKTISDSWTLSMMVMKEGAEKTIPKVTELLKGGFDDITKDLDELMDKAGKMFPSDEEKAERTKSTIQSIQDKVKELGKAYDEVGKKSDRATAEMIGNAQEVLDNQRVQDLVRMLGMPEQERSIKQIGQGVTGQGLFDSMSGLDSKEAEKMLADSGLAAGGDTMGSMMDADTEQTLQMSRQIKMEEERIRILDEFNALEIEKDKETQELIEQNMEAHHERLKKLQWARAQVVVTAWEASFDALSDAAKGFAGEQSAIYKSMFAMSKAFAIAESIIKIQQGIAGALSLPFPANLVAVASVATAAANIVSSIQAVKLTFGGEREEGGPVSPGKTFLVGEAGPEMFTPSTSGNIISNDQLTGGDRGNVKVIVNNYTDTRAEVTETQDSEGRVVEIVIRRLKQEISSEIRDGRGDINRSMESTYGLKRGKV